MLVGTSGGTQRRWRIVVGPVRPYDLVTRPRCSWPVNPAGTVSEVAEVERLLDQVRPDHVMVTAG